MVLQGLTLTQIESQVARNLLGIEFVDSAASANGSTTTLVDTSLSGGLDSRIGSWILFDSGANDGLEREVTDDDGAGTLTFAPAVTSTVAADTYKLFDRTGKFKSSLIRNVINDVLVDVTARWYKTEESVALHGDMVTSRFDLPSEFNGVRKIEFRSGHRSELVHDCESTFDETTDVEFTQVIDTQDKKLGSSLKISVGVGASAGNFVTDSISSVDLSRLTHLEGWVKSTVALSAADYKIHLDSATVAADGTDLESLDVPAVSADTWTFFRIALGNPASDTAIVSVGIEMDQDKGAHVIWFDDLRAVDNNSGHWVLINDNLWSIDHEAADLILSRSGVSEVGYNLMKITGGSIPSSMSTGATVATAPEEVLVYKATADLMMMTNDDRAQLWVLRAAQAMNKLRLPPGFRKVRS